jgi:hypothetical protein
MEAIEIHDRTASGLLAVELRDLLPYFESQAQRLQLYLLEFDVVLKDSSSRHLADLQARIAHSQAGLRMGWSELSELANEIFDVQNIALAGCAAVDAPIRTSKFHSLCNSCSLVVECFDSSFWRVCSEDAKIVQGIRERFSDVRRLDPPLG